MTTGARKPRRDPADRLMTVRELAELCGRSTRWLQSLRAAGFLKPESGGYRLGPALAGIGRYFEARATRPRPEVAAVEARTREIELRIAQRRADLIPTADTIAVLTEMGEMVRAEFPTLADRVFPDDPERREALAGHIRESLDRIERARLHAIRNLRGENLSGDGMP